jgi:hypothetical protein
MLSTEPTILGKTQLLLRPTIPFVEYKRERAWCSYDFTISSLNVLLVQILADPTPPSCSTCSSSSNSKQLTDDRIIKIRL